MSTELDLMGPAMWRLLKQAESGEISTADGGDRMVVEKETRFWA